MSAAPAHVWKLEPHVCAGCFGRVASRKPADGSSKVFRCTNCGAEGHGLARSVCACGSRIGKTDAGIRCVPNDAKGPDFPSEIIAKEVR